MPRATSPSMPSQLESANASSGSSSADGGSQLPQPDAPPQVCAPSHTFHGVMMLHGWVWPGLASVQSHAPLTGTHCSKSSPPTSTVSQSNPAGHVIVLQSRAQY